MQEFKQLKKSLTKYEYSFIRILKRKNMEQTEHNLEFLSDNNNRIEQCIIFGVRGSFYLERF
jgi:hypothetical protein